MQITLTRPDGLHILTRATLQRLAEDNTIRIFAEGLLLQALTELLLTDQATWSLAEALHHVDSTRINALLTVLLVLDAEVNAVLSNVDSPADAYVVLRLGEMSGRSTEYVLNKHKAGKGKGWGALAKSLGIKPGSKEFKALKSGAELKDQRYTDKGKNH